MSEELPDLPEFDPDNVSHLDMVAIQLNEMFMSLQRGGFTRKESLDLIGMILSNGVSYSPPEPDDDYPVRDFNEDDGEDFV